MRFFPLGLPFIGSIIPRDDCGTGHHRADDVELIEYRIAQFADWLAEWLSLKRFPLVLKHNRMNNPSGHFEGDRTAVKYQHSVYRSQNRSEKHLPMVLTVEGSNQPPDQTRKESRGGKMPARHY